MGLNGSNNWRQAILPLTATFEDILKNMSSTGLKIVLFLEPSGGLLGIISDGDIRKSLLEGLDLSSSISHFINKNAVVVSNLTSQEQALRIMLDNHVQQVPVVNEAGQVTGLHVWDEIASPVSRKNKMVIMAGGIGSRLRPLTEECPKPLIPVAGKPILERIIEHAKKGGINNFLLAINYLGHMIEDYFGDGKDFGVSIEYLKEKEPLGTAGALSLIKTRPKEPVIVGNGDLVMDIGYGEMLDFHDRLGATATMAIRPYEWQHPFGVVETNGADIVDFKEKPISRSHVNAGVYVLSPEALDGLEKNVKCDMPNVFDRLAKKNQRIVAFPMHEPWLDVGNARDLDEASKAITKKESAD